MANAHRHPASTGDCPKGFVDKHKLTRQNLLPRSPYLGSLNARGTSTVWRRPSDPIKQSSIRLQHHFGDSSPGGCRWRSVQRAWSLHTNPVARIYPWSLKERRLRISSTSPDPEAHCCRDFVWISGVANRLYAVRRCAIISVSTIR